MIVSVYKGFDYIVGDLGTVDLTQYQEKYGHVPKPKDTAKFIFTSKNSNWAITRESQFSVAAEMALREFRKHHSSTPAVLLLGI